MIIKRTQARSPELLRKASVKESKEASTSQPVIGVIKQLNLFLDNFMRFLVSDFI